MKTAQIASEVVASRLPMEDRKVADRFHRGKEIINGYGYEVELVLVDGRDRVYKVERLSTSLLEDNSAVYRVTLRECDCPDFRAARAGLCKHRIAVLIREEMDRCRMDCNG